MRAPPGCSHPRRPAGEAPRAACRRGQAIGEYGVPEHRVHRCSGRPASASSPGRRARPIVTRSAISPIAGGVGTQVEDHRAHVVGASFPLAFPFQHEFGRLEESTGVEMVLCGEQGAPELPRARRDGFLEGIDSRFPLTGDEHVEAGRERFAETRREGVRDRHRRQRPRAAARCRRIRQSTRRPWGAPGRS